MKKKIKVFLCDDHRLFREGLKKLLELEKAILVVGEAGGGREALSWLKKNQADVILLDISMPEPDGLEVIKKIKKERYAVKIVVLTMHQDENHLFEAIQNGAVGYILKGASGNELIEGICKADKEEALLEPKIAAKILTGFKALSQKGALAQGRTAGGLTERENEVLRWITLGAGNKEIASRLAISEKTVKNHVSNIFQKLQVKSRTQAAISVFRKKKDQD